VLGVDGLEWRLVLELAAKGRLPELRRMMHEGVAARMKPLEPAISPPIWTSMATGVLPERHGIRAFVQPGLRDERGGPVLYGSRERRVKALWDIVGDAGLSSCVVGYWMTFPAEEIRGVMVAQTGAPPGANSRKGGLREGQSGQVHPVDLETRIFELARGADPEGRAREIFGDTAAWPPAMRRLAEHSHWSLAADAAYERIALDLLAERGRCDLLIVYLGLPDVLGHRFWRWTYPEDFASPPSAEECRAYGDVLARVYARVDAFASSLRRAAGPGATLVVASDHGMGAFRPKAAVDLSREDAPLLRSGGHSAARHAFFLGAGPGLRREGLSASSIGEVALRGSVVDFAPTMLALLGLARGADMDGRPMTDLLDPDFLAAHPLREIPTHTPADWASTRRFVAANAAPPADRVEQLRGLGYLE
jgi:arylsulfatase A-like enzyme